MKLFLLGALCAFCTVSKAQTFVAGSGLTLSKLHDQFSNIYGNHITAFTGEAGIEYAKRKDFYITSTLGYARKGGKGTLAFEDANNIFRYENARQYFDYAIVNTFMSVTPFTKTKVQPSFNVGIWVADLSAPVDTSTRTTSLINLLLVVW